MSESIVVTFLAEEDRPKESGSVAEGEAGHYLNMDIQPTKLSYVDCMQEKIDESLAVALGGTARAVAEESCRSSCIEGGDYVVQISVDKFPDDLNYTMEASAGVLGPKIREEENYAESSLILLDDHHKPGVYLQGTPSAEWEGNLRGEGGVRITKPSISWNEEEKQFEWGISVFGTLRVTGTRASDVFLLTISPNPDSETSSAYQSDVMAFWGSNVTVESIDGPEIAGNCGSRSAFLLNPDQDTCWKRIITVHPCSGEIVSDERVQVECPEEGET